MPSWRWNCRADCPGGLRRDEVRAPEPRREGRVGGLHDGARRERDVGPASPAAQDDRRWKMTEYSFAGIDKPIGISTYKLTRALPSRLKSVLPTVEEIEQELSRTVKAVGSRAASPKGKAARKKKRAPRAR